MIRLLDHLGAPLYIDPSTVKGIVSSVVGDGFSALILASGDKITVRGLRDDVYSTLFPTSPS